MVGVIETQESHQRDGGKSRDKRSDSTDYEHEQTDNSIKQTEITPGSAKQACFCSGTHVLLLVVTTNTTGLTIDNIGATATWVHGSISGE